MSMVQTDNLEVSYQQSKRTVKLAEGDITCLSAEESVDYLIVSVLAGDYSPTPGSVVGALKSKGVDMAALAENKEKSWMPEYPCWISKPVTGQNFKRLVVYESNGDKREALDCVTFVFSAIADFEKQSVTAVKAAIPLLCTGSGGVDKESMLEELFFTSVHWGAMRFPLSEITLVLYSGTDALRKEFSDLKYKYQHLSQLFSNQIYQFYANQSLQNPGAVDEYLAERERFAICLYTSNYYVTINRILRDDNRESKEYRDHRPLFEAIDTGLLNLSDYQKLVYRGESDMSEERLAANQKGKHVENTAYTSTSAVMGAFYYPSNYRFHMNSLTGSSIESYSTIPSEHEVLMKRRLSYLVDEAEEVKEDTIFYLFHVTEDAVVLER